MVGSQAPWQMGKEIVASNLLTLINQVQVPKLNGVGCGMGGNLRQRVVVACWEQQE